jgi:hypothetical protein
MPARLECGSRKKKGDAGIFLNSGAFFVPRGLQNEEVMGEHNSKLLNAFSK